MPLPTWKESALFIEQQRLRRLAYSGYFKPFLEEITKAFQSSATKNQGSLPSAFLSYAHPIAGRFNEDWTKPAILNLRDDLRTAGITVVIDERDSRTGGDTRQFMVDEVAKCGSVILVGTKTLYTKVTTTKEDGSHYAVHFEVLHIIKKYLLSAWTPIEELIAQEKISGSLATEAAALSTELSQAFQNLEGLKESWIHLKEKIKAYKARLTQAGITWTDSLNPILPIIISGLCGDNSTPTEEKAIPFFPGQMTIQEWARNGTGETLHISYLRNLIILISSVCEQHWAVEPKILEGVIEQKLRALEQTHLNMPLWTQGLSEDETKEYPSISGAWNHPENGLTEIDNACQTTRILAVKYGPNLEKLKRILIEKHERNAEVPLAFQRLKTKTNGSYIHLGIDSVHEKKSNENPLTLEDIFPTDDTTQSRVLITGVAGIGKTTCTRHLVNEGAQGRLWKFKNFNWVLLIPLKALTKRPYHSVQEAVVDLTFPQGCLNQNLHTHFWSLLVNQKENVLFVLDGLDEINLTQQPTASPHLTDIVMELMDWPNLIITGRPHAILPVGITVDQHYQLTGFNNKDVIDYTVNYFKVLGKPEASENLIADINNTIIPKQILNTPIVLGLTCFVYACNPETFDNDITKTKLYQECWEKMSIIYWEKYGDQTLGTQQAIIQRSEPILQFIGKIAYEKILTQNMQSLSGRSLVKEYSDLSPLRQSLQHGWIQAIASNENPDTLLLDLYDYEMPHLTFAEFCAAHHLVSKLIADESGCMEEITGMIKNQKFHMALQFVFGIVANQHPAYLTRLLNVLLSTYTTTGDDEQLYVAIPCLQESGVDHDWIREKKILDLAGATLHRKILSKKTNSTSAGDFFRRLSQNPRISSRIVYERNTGFNTIAIETTKEMIAQNETSLGVPDAATIINMISTLGSAPELDDNGRIRWTDLSLSLLESTKNLPAAYRSTLKWVDFMFSYIADIILPQFNATSHFNNALNRVLEFLNTQPARIHRGYYATLFRQYETENRGDHSNEENTVTHFKKKFRALRVAAGRKEFERTVLDDFFTQYNQNIHLLNSERIDDLLSLVDTSKDLEDPELSRKIFTLMKSAQERWEMLPASKRIIEHLAKHDSARLRFWVVEVLSNAVIDPTQDKWYLSLATELASDPDHTVRRRLIQFLGNQTNFAAGRWEKIRQCLSHFITESNAALRTELFLALLNFLSAAQIQHNKNAVGFIIDGIKNIITPEIAKEFFLSFERLLSVTTFLGSDQQQKLLTDILQELITADNLRETIHFTNSTITVQLEERVFKKDQNQDDFRKKYADERFSLRRIETEDKTIYHAFLFLSTAIILPVIAGLTHESLAPYLTPQRPAPPIDTLWEKMRKNLSDQAISVTFLEKNENLSIQDIEYILITLIKQSEHDIEFKLILMKILNHPLLSNDSRETYLNAIAQINNLRIDRIQKEKVTQYLIGPLSKILSTNQTPESLKNILIHTIIQHLSQNSHLAHLLEFMSNPEKSFLSHQACISTVFNEITKRALTSEEITWSLEFFQKINSNFFSGQKERSPRNHLFFSPSKTNGSLFEFLQHILDHQDLLRIEHIEKIIPLLSKATLDHDEHETILMATLRQLTLIHCHEAPQERDDKEKLVIESVKIILKKNLLLSKEANNTLLDECQKCLKAVQSDIVKNRPLLQTENQKLLRQLHTLAVEISNKRKLGSCSQDQPSQQKP